MDTPLLKKKPGRKKMYENSKGYGEGAPRLATRIRPEALEWIESRPEGVRPYIERIVLEDKERSQFIEIHQD